MNAQRGRGPDSSDPQAGPEMAKKGSGKKSVKSLFSKSDASLDESVEKDVQKTEGEKKKFKLFSFKTKSKKDSANEKSASESQQVLRYAYQTA